jgi:hypothetical protein
MTDVNTLSIKEHSTVIGSDGQHVGTVDHVEGDRIKLAKNDPDSGGVHHYIPFDSIAGVDGNTVRLNQTAAQVKATWS